MFQSIISEVPEVWQIIVTLAVTIVLSVAFGLIYCLLKQKDGYFKDMPITLVVFPIIVCGITVAISAIMYQFAGDFTAVRYGRVAAALLTALVMIKFRSQQRTTEDLTYLFFILAFGLIMGLGYLYFALVLYAVIVLVIVLLYAFHFPLMSKRNLNLKITIPEDLNYENAFDDVFAKYTTYSRLTKVKTSDLGTMFVLNYEIITKPHISKKQFIDELREKNGNLNIILSVKKFTSTDN